jgi:cystathionine beta-lyase/cystathionine gamma-synthase
MKLETALIHAGEPRPGWGGAVAMPIFQSSTFLYQPGAGYHDIRYSRLSNTPNHEALHRKLAALEGTESALVTASGMAAISAALLSVLRTGDHLLAQEGLYGGTHDLLTGDFPQLGIEVSFVDGEDRSAWAAALRKTTRAFYCESISNPLVRVADLEGVASFSRSNGLISMIDNTFATPIGLRPTSLGFDLILHSATKYLNGHDDLIAGAVMGSSERISSVKHKLDHLGGSMDPHACFMLHRGLKTLAVRFDRQCATALQIARYLEQHSAVSVVNYPGLEGHPQYLRVRSLLARPGAMLSFELEGGVTAADRFFKRIQLPLVAPSLGGVETLVTRPALTSHVGLSPDERRRIGIADGLIRMSVGLEAADDLIADLASALST